MSVLTKAKAEGRHKGRPSKLHDKRGEIRALESHSFNRSQIALAVKGNRLLELCSLCDQADLLGEDFLAAGGAQVPDLGLEPGFLVGRRGTCIT